MSWVSTPRAGYAVGDPGLFSFLGKVAGAVVGSIPGVSTVAKVAGTLVNAITNKRPAPAGPAMAMPVSALGGFGRALTAQPRGPLLPAPIAMPGGAIVRADSVKVQTGSKIGPGGSLFTGPSTTTFYGPQTTPGAPTGSQVCGDGRVRATHSNKSGYHLKDGTYVAPGSRCVANRRRNPLNPRALSRAMSRVAGAQKAVRSLIRFESVSRGGKLVMKRPGRRKR
jgi:hypothetical protein